jgi:hypothetical protein
VAGAAAHDAGIAQQATSQATDGPTTICDARADANPVAGAAPIEDRASARECTALTEHSERTLRSLSVEEAATLVRSLLAEAYNAAAAEAAAELVRNGFFCGKALAACTIEDLRALGMNTLYGRHIWRSLTDFKTKGHVPRRWLTS